jgi:hypothetical protein
MENKNPTACKHYPLCEPLKTLIGKLTLKALDTYTDILTAEAALVCSRCDNFELKEILSIRRIKS